MNTIVSEYDPTVKHPANYMQDDFVVDKKGRKIRRSFRYDSLTQLFDQDTYSSRAVRNTCLFYIRNVRSALCKSPEERTHNETEVMHYVFMAVTSLNKRLAQDYQEIKKAIAIDRGMIGMAKACSMYYLIQETDKDYTPYPSRGKWMLSYRILDEVMKITKDQGYYGCTSQVNQQAIKKCTKSWKSFFSTLKDYRVQPWKYTAKPHEPGYIRDKHTTACYTFQVCEFTQKNGKAYLTFTNCKEVLCIGRSDLYQGKFKQAEVLYRDGKYSVHVTMDNGSSFPEAPEHPSRMMAMDPGCTNFMTVVTNTGMTPFILDGRRLKSINRLFNKKRAQLLSDLTRGQETERSRKRSKRLTALSKNRDNMLADLFYKYSHYVCRLASTDGIEVIVVGHNKGQKQEISIDGINNQNFVTIPYTDFIGKLRCVAAKYGIAVVEREESYTSRASLLDKDNIPTYAPGEHKPYVFSGRRKHRGLYVSKNGTELNADVNGACNILRKEYPYAFNDVDPGYLSKTVKVVKWEDVCRIKNRPNKQARRLKPSDNQSIRHRERKTQHRKLMEIFAVLLPADQDPDVSRRQKKAAETIAKKNEAAKQGGQFRKNTRKKHKEVA